MLKSFFSPLLVEKLSYLQNLTLMHKINDEMFKFECYHPFPTHLAHGKFSRLLSYNSESVSFSGKAFFFIYFRMSTIVTKRHNFSVVIFYYREETTAYRNELEHVNKLLQESKEATTHAVQLALAEVVSFAVFLPHSQHIIRHQYVNVCFIL